MLCQPADFIDEALRKTMKKTGDSLAALTRR